MTAFGLSPASFNNENKMNMLVLGTGAGLLTMFLQSQFKDHIGKLDTVDNNATMLKIAAEQFGFKLNKHGKSHTADALTWVKGVQKNFYNLICMDINYEEGNDQISPPLKFMAPDYVKRLMGLLKESGVLTFNIICYEKELLQKAVDMLNVSAGDDVKLFYVHCQSEMNYEIFFVKGEADFDNRADNLTAFLKARGVNKGQWMTEMDMAEIVEKVKPIDQLTGDEIKA